MRSVQNQNREPLWTAVPQHTNSKSRFMPKPSAICVTLGNRCNICFRFHRNSPPSKVCTDVCCWWSRTYCSHSERAPFFSIVDVFVLVWGWRSRVSVPIYTVTGVFIRSHCPFWFGKPRQIMELPFSAFSLHPSRLYRSPLLPLRCCNNASWAKRLQRIPTVAYRLLESPSTAYHESECCIYTTLLSIS